jgi:hypothetical protein
MVSEGFKQTGEIHKVPQGLVAEKPSIVSFFEQIEECHTREHRKDKY